MSAIDRLAGSAGVQQISSRPFGADAAGAARDTLGEIGHRVLAWTERSFGRGDGGQAWASGSGRAPGGFAPNDGELSARGDVYGLRELSTGLAQRFGATPTEEGRLVRAVEDFTRAAALRFNGLAGAAPDRQVSDVSRALNDAVDGAAGDGVDGVTSRIETAARLLSGDR